VGVLEPNAVSHHRCGAVIGPCRGPGNSSGRGLCRPGAIRFLNTSHKSVSFFYFNLLKNSFHR
jgi:hypothetical protein